MGCVLARLRVIGFSKRAKQARRNPMQKRSGGPYSKNTISPNPRLRQASIREKEGPSLGKNKKVKKILISEVPTLWKCEGRVPRRDWKTTAMRPKARHGTLQKKTYTGLKEKGHGYIALAPRREWVLPAASNKNSRRKREFCGRFRAPVCNMGQQEKTLNSAEISGQ